MKRTLLFLLVLVAAVLPTASSSAGFLSGANLSVLPREPQLRPGALGNGALNSLQYADPAEMMVVMEPPDANPQGGARLEHPLLIPRGRGGFQPRLSLMYDSAGGNSWVGNGWDLSIGEVAIDTRWGVPRFDAAKESETYLLDGQVLNPTAVRAEWQNRVADRADFTRRVESKYELIIRHGNSPKNYWWEVRDKMGNIRWYGGYPDDGGPSVGVASDAHPSLKQDPSAILFDDDGNAYRWGLSATRDVGVNMMRFFYQKTDGQRVGSAQITAGRQMYLSRILYTAAATASPAGSEDPPYEVRFLRDGAISPAPAPRKDVIVSARGGFLQVTSDLLRRVEIWYGDPLPEPPGDARRASRTVYDKLSRRYDLNYQEGAFGKSLLKSVNQVGSDGVVYGTHLFDYYDDVRDNAGAYNGFSPEVSWNTGSDNLQGNALAPVNLSALGASETNAGDGHIYVGFNPLIPGKTGSFGGSLTIRGGATEGLAEMMDINGDLLPDKIFRESRGGPIYYRLNTSGPDRGSTFGPKLPVSNLGKLSTEFNIGLAGTIGAYFGVFAEFTVAGDVTVGEDYFTDVNSDGLPDFVSAGTVYFNRLDATSGHPTFDTSSSLTSVPITTSAASVPPIPAITDLEAQRAKQSPLQDTVRRWVAPFSGTIAIDAPVTLQLPVVPGDPVTAYTGDGVRVAVQRNGSQLWTATLTTPGATATPTGVGALAVTKGDRIYFRVGPIHDGARDQVKWDPTITYTHTSPADVNGLSQKVFDASADFTLAGRPGTVGAMPLKGTVRFEGTLKKTAATSDDVTVLVLKNGIPVFTRVVTAATVNAAGIPLSGDFPVLAPTDTTRDQVEVRIAVDSPIDVTALDLDHKLFYIAADPVNGQSIPLLDSNNKPTLVLPIPADTDIYPENTLTAPRQPWVSNLAGAVTARATLTVAGDSGGGAAIVTVKSAAGILAKQTLTVPNSPLPSAPFVDIPLTLASGTNYWFDITIRNANLSEKVTAHTVVIGTDTIPSVRNWAGRQNIFPIAYRGWGYAGYNGDGPRAGTPIIEADFVLKQEDFPQTPIEPTGFDDPNFKDPSQAKSFAFVAAQIETRNAAGSVVGTPFPAWRGMKDNILGTADLMRASRGGADNPSLGIATGAGAQAVRRVAVTAPVFSLTAGIGPASLSFGVGPSFGLVDYMDLNGDGFPDIVAPGYVKYTNPRGGYYSDGSGVGIVNQDTTFAFNGGLGGTAVEVKSNARGDANSAQNTASVSGASGKPTNSSAASTGEAAAESLYGANVGGSLGISVSLTNPGAVDAELNDELAKMPGNDRTAPYEQELADVNGDGLPDRVIVSPQGVFVRFNLGYRFASQEVKWSGGGFENNESYTGSVGAAVGFFTLYREFSGGLGLSESLDMARYAWVDVDGDGILDRLHKELTGNRVTVAFGTNSGLLDDVVYGPLSEGAFDLVGSIPIPTGQQIAFGRGTSLGAGADFTVSIGPLCLVACYIIINPGIHFDHSISNTQIQLMDVDGDTFPDSVKSQSDNSLKVRFNNRGRTNLLRSVSNPLGGKTRLGYARDGNTVDQPNSVWNMVSVEADDGRPGDGADVQLSTFEYAGDRYNKLEREMLGYSSLIERQREFKGDGNVSDDPILRTIERTYLNNTVFDSGLMTGQTLKGPTGAKLQESRSTWVLIDLATKNPANLDPTATDPAGLRLLSMAVGANLTKVENRWFESNGTAVGQETWLTYEYDDLGNVVRQVDIGEPELPGDDVIALIEYTNCENASDSASYEPAAWACPAVSPNGVPASSPLPPYWNTKRCPTWTSLPAKMTITDAGGAILRQRDGAPALCDNSSVTDLREWYGPGANEFAQTLLSYDDWGSYSHIEYPENATGQRLIVDYVYDENSAANIASTTDSHGLTATATFDGRTGRIASRTDANGQVTSYTYDAFSRIATITGPYEQGTGNVTVRFEYSPAATGYGYAVARHFDVLHPADTIDTATFVDGGGRRTQTKMDASVFRGAASAPASVMLVSPATEIDALGRTVKTRYPVEEPLGTIGTFNSSLAGLPTTMTWNLLDQQTKLDAPGGRTVTTAYEFASDAAVGGGAKLFKITVTDPLGKPQTSWHDVHDNVYAVDDQATGQPTIRTRFGYDQLGQLLRVQDNAGNVTTHTYDRMGRRTSTETPDGGKVETIWDGASNVIGEITPILRAAGQQIRHSYDIDWLTKTDYPDTTPDVTYTYGAAGAAGNGAGRVTAISDGARTQQLTYERLGEVGSIVARMTLHNGPSEPFTTSFTRDGFGRLLTVTYPDGEVLSHGYDSGGLLSSLRGVKETLTTDYLKRREYDEFQTRRYQEFANNVRTEYTYDPATRRLARLLTNTSVREVQDLNYKYDLAGNVLEMDNQLPPPQTSLKGGPSKQTYTYDAFYRLLTATGTAPLAPNQQRDYTYAVTYDLHGNTKSKDQRDTQSQVANNGAVRNPKVQEDTTYKFDPMNYRPAKPHQIASTTGKTYTHDLNGNLTRVVDTTKKPNPTQRIITWDAANRVRNINDTSDSTDYRYDHQGLLSVQRGPQGEKAFVNSWYQTINGGWKWKQIWADDDRIAQSTEQLVCTDEDGDGVQTCVLVPLRYYNHEDLQGSTNIVTDTQGLVFEHIEYFPSGEIWMQENSTTHRTPYRFNGAYNDETRNLNNHGQRWYEPREQLFYSPDPMLEEQPGAVIGDPALLPAYTYAESNPLRLYDYDGRAPKDPLARLNSRFTTGQILMAWGEAREHSRLWQSFVRLALTNRSEKLLAFSERYEAKPLLQFNLTRGDDGHTLQDIKAGFFWKQKTVFEAATTASPPPRPTTNPSPPNKPLPPLPPSANAGANKPLPPIPAQAKPLPPVPVRGNAGVVRGASKPLPNTPVK